MRKSIYIVLMAIIIGLLIFIISNQSSKTQLLPFHEYGSWGYMNGRGDIIIIPQFDEVGLFSEGFARVMVDGRWGYIDQNGKYVVNPIYEDAKDFSEGLAAVMQTDTWDWGYIDTTFSLIIKARFDDAANFSEGLARVKIKGQYGYIDKKGKFAIEAQFDNAGEQFSEGFVQVSIDDRFGYINKKGQVVIEAQYEDAHPFSEGLAGVKIKGKWGFINKSGQVVILPQFDAIGYFSEALASVMADGLWGYIDQAGRYVIEAQYDAAGEFSEGLAAIEKDNKEGYINKNGEIEIQLKFDDAKHFSEGFAAVRINDSDNYINKDGELIWKSKTKNKTEIMAWEHSFRSHRNDAVFDALKTADGGYIMVGTTTSSGNENSDILVLKTDENGKEQWVQIFGGENHEEAIAIRKTEDGGYLVVGNKQSFEASREELSRLRLSERMLYDAFPGFDIWLIKLNSEGQKQWEQTLGGNSYDAALMVEKHNDGYLIIGTSTSFSYDISTIIFKIDQHGKKIWRHIYDITMPSSIYQTTDNGFMLSGLKSGSTYLMKINSSGNVQWTKSYSSSFFEQLIRGIFYTASDGSHLMKGTKFQDQGSSAWVFKIDSQGEKVWDKTFTELDNYTTFIDSASPDEIILAGSKKFETFHETRTSYRTTVIHNVRIKGKFIKINSAGEVIQSFYINCPDNYTEYFIRPTFDKGYLLIGDISSRMFNIGLNYRLRSITDVWILKTDRYGRKEWDCNLGNANVSYVVSKVIETGDKNYTLIGNKLNIENRTRDVWMMKIAVRNSRAGSG